MHDVHVFLFPTVIEGPHVPAEMDLDLLVHASDYAVWDAKVWQVQRAAVIHRRDEGIGQVCAALERQVDSLPCHHGAATEVRGGALPHRASYLANDVVPTMWVLVCREATMRTQQLVRSYLFDYPMALLYQDKLSDILEKAVSPPPEISAEPIQLGHYGHPETPEAEDASSISCGYVPKQVPQFSAFGIVPSQITECRAPPVLPEVSATSGQHPKKRKHKKHTF